MPDADIQSIKPREETLTENSYISSADGWLVKNKITTEEQQAAISVGQVEMEQAIKKSDNTDSSEVGLRSWTKA